MLKFLVLVLIVTLIPGCWFYFMTPQSRRALMGTLLRWVPLLLLAVSVVFAAIAFFTQVQAIRLL